MRSERTHSLSAASGRFLDAADLAEVSTASAAPEHPRWTAPEVLLVLEDESDLAIARAAFHLIGLPVRAANSFHLVFPSRFAPPPLLVLYDRAIVARSAVELELLATLRRRGTPLLALSDRVEADVPELVLARPLTPLDLLGQAAQVQPRVYVDGAAELVEPDPDDNLLLLTHDLRRAAENATQEAALRAAAPSAEQCLSDAAVSLLEVMALRDIETAAHCRRVHAYACRLALRVAPEILDDPTTRLGFLLHDIGKLALPDSILQKPGRLTGPERQLMRTHPAVGFEMTRRFLPNGPGLNVIRFHHERWDGHGYPDGLTGTAIPIEARIFAVADALDALTSNRPYRTAAAWPNAVRTLTGDAATQFDPTVTAALEQEAHRLRELGSRGALNGVSERHDRTVITACADAWPAPAR